MPSTELWAGALSLMLIHTETGCPHSARKAALLLEQLSDDDDLAADIRLLCERASERLCREERDHAGAA